MVCAEFTASLPVEPYRFTVSLTPMDLSLTLVRGLPASPTCFYRKSRLLVCLACFYERINLEPGTSNVARALMGSGVSEMEQS